MGYYTVLITNNLNQLKQRREYEEVHLMQYCDLNNVENVIETIKQLQRKSLNICTIISFVDPYCALAALMCEKFNLPGFTYQAINNMQNKIVSRKLLEQTNLNPRFIQLDYPHYNFNHHIRTLLPLVVKYVDSNGSKDVYYVETPAAYYESLVKITSTYYHPTIICEEYIQGKQYIVEALVENENVHIVATIKQEIEYLNGHFIITGYTPILDEDEKFKSSLYEAVKTVVEKHGYKHGPCHLEMRLTKNGWKMVEINPRISGAGMNKLLETAFGISLVKETIKLALNEEIDLEPKFKRYTHSEYITISQYGRLERVTGENKARKSDGVVEVYIKPRKGQILSPPRSNIQFHLSRI